MEIAIPIVLGLLLVLVVVVVGLGAVARNAGQRKTAVEDPDIETLRYAVPTGQDPAALMAALTGSGHQATSEPAPHGHDLLVACPHGKREEIRGVIARTDVSGVGGHGEQVDTGRVRFADE